MICPPHRFCLFFVGLLAAGLASHAQSNYSTPYYFSTFAGINSIGSADGQGSAARFYYPGDAATDASGNIYLADTQNHTIRKISPGGLATTFAGMAGMPGSVDGSGNAARFSFPSNLTVDASGNVYVADSGNRTIRKITPTGVVTTFAGRPGEAGTVDGTGSSARFQNPLGLTLSTDGNLYVADDSGDHLVSYMKRELRESLIRKITPTGIVTTFATGLNKNSYTGSGASGTEPFQVITSDAQGNLYVVSHTQISPLESNLITVNQVIFSYTPSGTRTTLFQTTGFISRYPPGVGRPYGPSGFISDLEVDASGKLFAVKNYELTQFDLQATPAPIETVLLSGWQQGQMANPPALGASLRLASERNGNLLIVDRYENVLWRLTRSLVVTALAGMPAAEAGRSLDGPGILARFKLPYAPCFDRSGNLYIADYSDHVIRKISPAGETTSLAGLAEKIGNSDGPGPMARFNSPAGMAIDRLGQIYVADMFNRVIRRISSTGETSTFAGSGAYDNQDGPAATASFSSPSDVALDGLGNLYVIDEACIRRISPAGEVTTFAGVANDGGSADGLGTAARFSYPSGLTTDQAGNIYVADTGNHTIRKITPEGNVSTIAGRSPEAGSIDGPSSVARFNNPSDLAMDASGDLFVVDAGNHTIRRISTGGDVSTVAGLVSNNTNAEGLGAQAHFSSPYQLTVGPDQDLYVSNGTAIMRGQRAGLPIISTQPQSQTVGSGSNVQFAVTAGGVPAPTYQWYFNGSPFAGATSSTLGFPNARSSDAGDYTVVITNSLGSVTSSKATLTVSAASAPTPAPTPSPASGGGSIEAWFLLGLLTLIPLRRSMKNSVAA